ncbi:MAG: hypothetical protein AAFU79_22940, partial [Myxococcota bacterium]
MTEDEWADEGLLGERSDEDLAWTPTGPAGENPLKGKYRLELPVEVILALERILSRRSSWGPRKVLVRPFPEETFVG